MLRSRLRIALLAVFVLLSPRSSHAAFHLAVIDEVMTSYSGDPTAQFVEIRMLTVGQIFVNGSTLGVFDASGNFLGDALTTGSNVANGVTDGRWIMATSSLTAAVGGGWTPDFTIPGPLLLQNGSGMVCWGIPSNHMDPNQYVDCVAYGSYIGPTGPSNFHIGTPTSLDGEGHSLQRIANTNNNLQDFICGDPSTPTNNTPMSGSLPATSACPPTPTPTATPTQTPTATPTIGMNDAVVLPPKPISAKIPLGDPTVVKNVRVKVRNASAATVPIKLVATGCGGAVTGTPDFDRMMPGPQDSAVVAPGKSKKAVVPVTISNAGFTPFNHHAPARCQLTFTAMADVPGNIDPAPGNNTVGMELSVIDLNDPDSQASPNHESFTKSLKPVTVKIANGASSKSKSIKLKVGNADAEVDPGHQITVTLGAGDCPPAAVGLPDFDKDTGGVQNNVTVKGEKTASGTVSVTINQMDFLTTNPNSPARCVRQLCAAGPMGNVEPDTSNDCTQLVLDLIDGNDF